MVIRALSSSKELGAALTLFTVDSDASLRLTAEAE